MTEFQGVPRLGGSQNEESMTDDKRPQDFDRQSSNDPYPADRQRAADVPYRQQSNPAGDYPDNRPDERQQPASDPYLKSGRAGETHGAPPQREYGEGVVTGDDPDHYVHLANGAVIAGSSGGTVYHDAETDSLVPIVRAFPAGKSLPRE